MQEKDTQAIMHKHCFVNGAAGSVLPSMVAEGGVCQPPASSTSVPALHSTGTPPAHKPAGHLGALPVGALDHADAALNKSGLGGATYDRHCC